MANLSKVGRKQQVLDALTAAAGEWVDGPDLANERVGGSEGLKRLRELRAAGHPIEERRHPGPGRDIWQYRLLPDGPVEPKPRPGPVVAPLVPTLRKADIGPRCPRCQERLQDVQPQPLDPRYVSGQCPTHGRVVSRA
jgi:biotin operon repressor